MKATEKRSTGGVVDSAQATAQGQSPGQPQEQMELAYQIHTLAQMLYGHISASHPWATQSWNALQPMQAHMHPGLAALQSMQQGMHPGINAMQPMYPGIQPGHPGVTAGWANVQQGMPLPFLHYPFGPFPR